MSDFPNLPGTYVSRLDGGLRFSATDDAPVILLLGTADKGYGDEPFLGRDTARARALFGGSSELYRGLIETRRAYGDGANIYLFRIGTKPAYLTLSGLNQKKVRVIPRERTATLGETYKVSFIGGVTNTLWIYDESGSLVYSNSAANPVDAGVIEIRGTLAELSGAQSFGSSTGSYAGSVPMGSGTLTSGAVFQAATIGPAANDVRARYEALEDAYRLLDSFDLDIVVPLNVYADTPNVAFFISGVGGREYAKEPWNSPDNPLVFGSGVLGWFKKTAPSQASPDGTWTYQWANDVTASGVGVGSSAPNLWANSTARISAGFHEVSFAYQLADFCYRQTKNQSTCVGVIGFKPPVSYYAGDLHLWAGEPPVKNALGSITTNGFGLAGFPETVGAGSSYLNPLCHDKSTGRAPGFFATDGGYKDEAAIADTGGYSVDIGAYISLVGESPEHLNTIGGTVGYTATAAPYYAGLIAKLDELVAPTNQICPGLRVPYKLGKRRLDNLTAAKIVMLTNRRNGVFVVDAPTAATSQSDYRRLSTVRIVSLVERVVRREGEKYIGKVVNQLLEEAFKSDLEEALQNLVVRGYLKSYRYNIEATPVEKVLGKLNVKLILSVPHELRQIFYTLSLSLD